MSGWLPLVARSAAVSSLLLVRKRLAPEFTSDWSTRVGGGKREGGGGGGGGGGGWGEGRGGGGWERGRGGGERGSDEKEKYVEPWYFPVLGFSFGMENTQR